MTKPPIPPAIAARFAAALRPHLRRGDPNPEKLLADPQLLLALAARHRAAARACDKVRRGMAWAAKAPTAAEAGAILLAASRPPPDVPEIDYAELLDRKLGLLDSPLWKPKRRGKRESGGVWVDDPPHTPAGFYRIDEAGGIVGPEESAKTGQTARRTCARSPARARAQGQ